ncbi:uncharacterized protein SAZU_0730 [Streptomyces azureus]|uniref:Uncharacterized protein n=1 Tax=Streptomyces azureus TaxID=146537 RepID=A0A0K8PE32_STRAJ|nr:uncharacterized protein SAZU_0730 [Streptomyces azureus]
MQLFEVVAPAWCDPPGIQRVVRQFAGNFDELGCERVRFPFVVRAGWPEFTLCRLRAGREELTWWITRRGVAAVGPSRAIRCT